MQVPHDSTHDEYILSCVRKYQEKLTVRNRNLTVSLGYLLDNRKEMALAMAEEIHDTWTAQKSLDGHHYAENTDKELKLHSCMKPFHLLTDEEKNYDVVTAETTIAQLIKALDK